MAPGPGGGDGCASRTRTDILSHPRTGGVLEMLAWSPAVQKAARLLSRSCRNRREQEGPPPAGRSLLHNRTRTWPGNLSSPPLKVDHIF
jgi:hypothetical protein